MFSKNITVLYPVLHYPPVIGGLEQWSQNIAERQPSDIFVTIVTGRVRGEPNFKEAGNVIVVRTSLFALRDLSHSSIFYIAGAFPFIIFRSLLLSKNADLFHCHGFVSALMGFFLALATGRPFIGTEQSIIWKGPVSKFLTALVYRKAYLCIASSRAVREWFRKIGVKRVEIIPNGVDLRKFSSSHSPRIRSNFVVLSVGRLEKVKGYTYLIKAFADVKKEIPDAKLVLVGDGSERKNLEKQALVFGLREDIEFVGEVPHENLPSWYHKADIFIMPSLSEGFGICAIEAMASGLPVVATKVGSLPEIIADGQTGILIEAGQPGAISRAVLQICADENLASRLAENGQKRAAEFDWHKSAEKVYKIYRSLQ